MPTTSDRILTTLSYHPNTLFSVDLTQTKLIVISDDFLSHSTSELTVLAMLQVRVWEVGREGMAGECLLTIIDENIAVLLYNFPDAAKANEEAIMEVGIARLGDIPAIPDMYAASNPGVSISIIDAYEASQSAVLVVSLKRDDPTIHGDVNVTLAACPDVQDCLKKSVQFTFLFRDPNAVWVMDVLPLNMYVDGRLPVSFDIENLPAGLTTNDFIVTFISNATVDSVVYKPAPLDNSLFAVVVTVIAPGVEEPTALIPTLQIPRLKMWGLGGAGAFTFSYLTAPSPSFSALVPAKAKTTVSAPIQLALQNFPGVADKSNIEIQFRWPSGQRVPASVSEFSRVNPSKHPLAIQDITALIFSPVGADVQEGSAQVLAFHSQYRRRVAKTDTSFTFIDATSPLIVGATSTGVDAGTDSVKVQMSKPTQVNLYVGNAKSEVAQVLLGTGTSSSGNTQYPLKGPSLIDLEMSSHDAPSKSAQVTFSVPGAKSSGPVHGMLKFEASCGGDVCASALCCESSSCVEQCKNRAGDSCKIACFQLHYFDDLQPRLVFSSTLEGPEIGGSVMQLTIAKLPKVDPGEPVGAMFDKRPELMGTVYVRESTDEETTLDLVTPAIQLRGLPSKRMPVKLEVLSRPDRPLTFQYTAQAVSPSMKSINPPTCFSNQPTPVTISIQYFPYPGEAVIMFGENIQIGAENITVLPVSNLQRTVITFLTPQTDPGMYRVLVFPKSCPKCGKSVMFQYVLRDPNQPEMVKPVPIQGQRYPGPVILDFVRVAKFPAIHNNLIIRFLIDSGKNYSTVPSSFERLSGGIAAISYRRPAIDETGGLNVSIDITTPIKGSNDSTVKSVAFPFVIYDETAMRIVSTLPESVSTQLSLYGRSLDLRSRIDLVIANFPANTPVESVKILLVGFEADVLSITDISRCANPFGDCNRTRLSILAPAADPPGVWSGELTIQGVPVLVISLKYFSPCNFQRYCESEGKVVDRNLLETKVPISASCDPQYCLNIANLKDPSIVNFSPVEGPSTGGTTVTVVAKNLPAFVTSDLTIEVGSIASKISISPETVQQSPGSSTAVCSGVFTFKMPPVSGGTFSVLSETGVTLKVALGITIRSASFQQPFVYTPVIQGRAVVSSFYPISAFPNEDIEIKVQLTNFLKLQSLDPVQVRLQFENVPGNVIDTEASSIKSSEYEGTLITFKTQDKLSVSRVMPVHVYYYVHGMARSGSFEFEVLPEPTPSKFSMFPLRGRANVLLNQAVIIQYLDPSVAAQAIWSVSLRGLVDKALAPPIVDVQSAAGCTKRYCSKYLINYEVPKDTIPSDGGDVTVTISADSDEVSFVFPFDADDTPSVESIDPNWMSIEDTQTGAKTITMYLKNVDAEFCKNPAKCTITFGGNAGGVSMSSYSSNLLTLSIVPPAVGTGGNTPGLIADGKIEIRFDYTFIAPPASFQPIDGACTGGETVSVQVLGWGVVVTDASSVAVMFGDKEGKVTQIVSSEASSSYSCTRFEVLTPMMSSGAPYWGEYIGVISSGSKSSSFNFDCFDPPTALASPNTATLDGRTSGPDGKSILLVLSNFPRIATTADIAVRFGDIVCDTSACSVVSFSGLGGTSGVTLVITPPKVDRSINVLLSASYIGKAEPPKWGDPSKRYQRAQKTAKTSFSHYRPKPVVLKARWCAECVPGSRTCIQSGKCANRAAPKSNAMGAQGSGVLTVEADNLPQIPIHTRSGMVMSPAKVEVFFGENIGVVRKAIYSDETRSAWEVALSSPVAFGSSLQMDLKVVADASRPISFSARSDIRFLDETMAIECDGGCHGPSTGSVHGHKDTRLYFMVQNLHSVMASSDVMVFFGDTLALDVELITKKSSIKNIAINAEPLIFAASVPAYHLSVFNGLATVELSIAFSSEKDLPIASTSFTYFAPPSFSSIRFSTTGTSIDVVFDSPTDRASMTRRNIDCRRILSSATVAMLGRRARCVWMSDLMMTIFLGDIKGLIAIGRHAIEPGDVIAIHPNVIKSRNKVSPYSATSGVVARPSVLATPEVSVKGPNTIDPCSGLEVRASILSPRPSKVKWSCRNDPDLHKYLELVNSETLTLPAGTSQLSTSNKEYEIEINVEDFLKVSSVPIIFKVLKKAAPAPKMEFNPPTVSIKRNQQILIKGETVFSSCPVDQTEVSFSWRQIAGPRCCPIPASILSANIPQVLLSANLLPAGSIYQLGLSASMEDTSQSSESIVTIRVGYQQLLASIAGGTRVSALAPLTLSAQGSRDPDVESSQQQGLLYSWGCSFVEDGAEYVCRSSDGAALALPLDSEVHSTITIAPGKLPPIDSNYIFSVVVRKGRRTSVPASMQVKVVEQAIPTLEIGIPENSNVIDGALVLNSNARAVFTASSSLNGTSFQWSISPGINISMPRVSPLGFRTSHFIFEASCAPLQAGSKYVLELLGSTPDGMAGQSTLVFIINSPPLGGSFVVCKEDLEESVGCVKTGRAIEDEFLLLAAGWTDPNLPVMYQFGYTMILEDKPALIIPPLNNNSNTSNTTKIAEEDDSPPGPSDIWFEWNLDSISRQGFPAGRLQLMCRVRDGLGASTTVLTEYINISSAEIVTTGPGGRRLLSASNFFDKAKEKLASALKTFRVDKVSQLANSLATHIDGGGLGPVDGSAMKTELMASLQSSTGKAVKSTGFACESFGAGKTVTGNSGQLNSGAVASSGGLLMSMVADGLGQGGMDMTCADNAASMMVSVVLTCDFFHLNSRIHNRRLRQASDL